MTETTYREMVAALIVEMFAAMESWVTRSSATMATF
jgi:hypothetical protein